MHIFKQKLKCLGCNKMCQLVTCSTCKKYSYAGCGNHLPTIFAGKKLSELCDCPSNTKVIEYKKQYRRVPKLSNTKSVA